MHAYRLYCLVPVCTCAGEEVLYNYGSEYFVATKEELDKAVVEARLREVGRSMGCSASQRGASRGLVGLGGGGACRSGRGCGVGPAVQP